MLGRNRAKEESELTHTHLSFKLWLWLDCLLWHCLINASNTAWGHNVGPTEPRKSLTHNHYPSNFDFDFSVFLLSFVALPLALCFKHSMGSHNVGPRNRAKEESELTHTHLSFKLWLWLFCFLLSFVALPRALCFKHSMGSHNVGPRNRAKEESELTHTHLSFKLWLWLVCFFIVFCGIASGSVLQTQHGVTQCWAEEQSQRRVWINTYPSILQTLWLVCFFIVFCGIALLFKHRWGHNVGPWNGAKEESFLTHNHVSFKLWLWLFFFFIVFCGIASGSVLQTQHGVTQCWAEEQSQRRVWINTYPSILQTLTLTFLFFIVFCGIALGSVLQTQHGVTQCWAEEQSQRRVWINTYPSILQTLTLTFLFFYCLLWHCLWLCASNTAWGHTMLGRGTEPQRN